MRIGAFMERKIAPRRLFRSIRPVRAAGGSRTPVEPTPVEPAPAGLLTRVGTLAREPYLDSAIPEHALVCYFVKSPEVDPQSPVPRFAYNTREAHVPANVFR